MSSFGAPGSLPPTKPTPPQRGSFPLDHEGECRHVMRNYLACMKKVRGLNDEECRGLAKSYLACRMDKSVKPMTTRKSMCRVYRTKDDEEEQCQLIAYRNLMARDDFKNLGFGEQSEQQDTNSAATSAATSNATSLRLEPRQ